MHKITHQGLSLIKQFEGFSHTPYVCPAGYLTIGYGHLVRQDETFDHVTEHEADVLLRSDVASAEKAVLRLINVPLSNSQYDALVSFTYNLGAGALQSSTLRRKVNREKHFSVPSEFNRWV